MKIQHWPNGCKVIRNDIERIAGILQLNEVQKKSLWALSALEKSGMYASVSTDKKEDAVAVDICCNSGRTIGRVWLICNNVINWEANLEIMQRQKAQELSALSLKLRDLSDMLKSLSK